MKVLAEALKKSGGGGRAAAQQQKEDHAWFVDTDEKVGMVAKSIVGSGPGAWERISSLIVDGEGIHAKVERNEHGLVTAFTQIDMNEERILIEANRAISAENVLNASIVVEADRITQEVSNRISGQTELSSRITQTATRIESEVEARIAGDTNLDSRITQTANMIDMEVTRATAAEGEMSGRITVEAGKITQIVNAVGKDGQVTAASICLAINNDSSSSATINADKIYLLGQTIADKITSNYIQSKIASLASLNVASLTSERGGIDVYSVKTTTIECGGVDCYLPSGIWNLQITQTGNTYKLQRKRFNDDDWVDVGSFSRAVSSWTWGGGSGKINVTALPQDQTKSVNVSIDGRNSITANGTYTYTVDYENSDGDDVSTGATKTVTVNISQRSVNDIRIAGTGNAYKSGNNVYKNITLSADYDTGGSHTETEVLDVTDAYDLGAAAGKSLVNNASIWEGNTRLSGTVTISGSKTVKAWCAYGDPSVDDNWVGGDTITFTAADPYSYSADITFTESKVIGSVTYFYYYSTSGITTGTKRVHWS